MPEIVSSPLRIVSIGGGNGLSTLLRGLKTYARPGLIPVQRTVDITAIVTVTDDGGSSGRLRREFDVLPPGDIRNCMVALSEDETLLSRLFQYRFSEGRGLKGHSFGNLFLTAMTNLTGDFGQAVKFSAEVLKVAGRIYPSTASNVTLEATLANGRKVTGETRISRSSIAIEKVTLRPRRAKPLPEALEAIAQADLITMGPGSLFTSIVPNLLVHGIPEAIAASPALKACFMNLMTQPGETTNFRASDHAAALLRHCGRLSGRLIDVCVVNTRAFSQKALESYRVQEAQPVEGDMEALKRMGMRVIATDLLPAGARRFMEKIRHDPAAVAAVAMDLAQQGRRARRKLAS